jgi:hypothetical protein
VYVTEERSSVPVFGTNFLIAHLVPFFAVLGLEPKVSFMLGNCCTTELYPQPIQCISMKAGSLLDLGKLTMICLLVFLFLCTMIISPSFFNFAFLCGSCRNWNWFRFTWWFYTCCLLFHALKLNELQIMRKVILMPSCSKL